MNLSNDLLKRIQELSFAKVETELYLDTHPDCQNALEFYNDILEELNDAMIKYQGSVRALFSEGAAGKRWSWVDESWPWHHGFADGEGRSK